MHRTTALQGLGENVPISTANLQDGFVALKGGRMILLCVPYPMGSFANGSGWTHLSPPAGLGARARRLAADRVNYADGLSHAPDPETLGEAASIRSGSRRSLTALLRATRAGRAPLS